MSTKSRFIACCWVSMASACNLAARTTLDPTSDAQQEREKKFIRKVEKNLKKDETANQRKDAPAAPTPQKAQGAITAETQKNLNKDPIRVNPSLKENPSIAVGEAQVQHHDTQVLSREHSSTVLQTRTIKHTQNDGVSSLPPQSTPRQKREFSGFFCGLSGSMNHMYADGAIYSCSRPPIGQKVGNLLYEKIFYGSYAYNENTWLVSGQAFVGYDAVLAGKMRLGLEVQGGRGWRSYEIASNGVFGNVNEKLSDRSMDLSLVEHSEDFTSLQVEDKGDVDFTYTRPTIRTPFHLSVLPRFGYLLSPSTLIYAKVGVLYENVIIDDNPETREVGIQRSPKAAKDTIYDKSKPTWLGGFGVETLVTKQFFLRMEYSCSGGSDVSMDKHDLRDLTDSKNTDRQLEDMQLKSRRSYRYGVGAGYRF